MTNIDQAPLPNPEVHHSPEEVFTTIAHLIETAIDPDQAGVPDSFRDRIQEVRFGWVSDTEGGTLAVDLSNVTRGITLRYREHGYEVFDSNYGKLEANATFRTRGQELEFEASGYDVDEVNNRDLAPEDYRHRQDGGQVIARIMDKLPYFSDPNCSSSVSVKLATKLDARHEKWPKRFPSKWMLGN